MVTVDVLLTIDKLLVGELVAVYELALVCCCGLPAVLPVTRRYITHPQVCSACF